MIKDLEIKEEKRMSTNQVIPLYFNEKDFNLLMSIYQKALDEVYDMLTKVQDMLGQVYGYNMLHSISKRIKTPESIISKMKKRHYDIDFENMLANINDIAGIRIACPVKSDIYQTIDMIKHMPNIKVIEEKDYLKKPKKTGYSAYHLIVETSVEDRNEKIPVKVEIQIRTMAMDFWATNEHKIRYKSNRKLSSIDSHKLTLYAKLINLLDEKMMEIYNKQVIS